jgi:hypothetical protein
MGGAIGNFISPAKKARDKRKKRERRERQAAEERERKAAEKLKKENEIKQKAEGAARIKRGRGRRRVFTGNPLGLGDEGTISLG